MPYSGFWCPRSTTHPHAYAPRVLWPWPGTNPAWFCFGVGLYRSANACAKARHQSDPYRLPGFHGHYLSLPSLCRICRRICTANRLCTFNRGQLCCAARPRCGIRNNPLRLILYRHPSRPAATMTGRRIFLTPSRFMLAPIIHFDSPFSEAYRAPFSVTHPPLH